MPLRTRPSGSRRRFLWGGAAGLVSLSLAGVLVERSLTTDEGSEALQGWLTRYLGLGEQLSGSQIGQTEWQSGMDALFEALPLSDLLAYINFDRVSEQLKKTPFEGGEIFHTVMFGGDRVDGAPAREPVRTVITKLAYVRKGAAVPPHGHGNMVSAFLHVSGEFHVKQFDKLADADDHLIVRPTLDVHRGTGFCSSISDAKNNCHWFTAMSDDAFLFTAKVIELERSVPVQGRINIDVRNAQDFGHGALKAPKISFQRAAELYG